MSILRRIANLFHRSKLDQEIESELRAHIEMRTADNIAAGMSREHARRDALMRFGNRVVMKERVTAADAHMFLDSLWQDLCYGLRMLRKSPGFTLVAVLTLALGIGATTAIFNLVDATLLHPLPYPHPDQLVRLVDDLPGIGAKDVSMSVPEWQDLQRSGIFEYISPDFFIDVNLTGSEQPARVRGLAVAPNYFALLGAKPQLGRVFNPEDHRPGWLMEAVISDALWSQSFGRDSNVLNRSLRLDGDLYRIIGVMPAGFHDPGRTTQARNIEVWIALGFAASPLPDPPVRNARLLPGVIARVKPGLSVAAAQSQVDSLTAALQKQFPSAYPLQSAWKVRLVPLSESVIGNVRQSLILLLGAVGLVLLIGCVNIANLLLARASTRGREMAIRLALGAERVRLIRQLLTESLLLSVFGGVLGFVILVASHRFLVRMVPASLPHLNAVSINWSVLGFALCISLLAGAIFGLAPALHAGRLDLTHTLKQDTRHATGSSEQARTRRILVVTEFALSLVLMVSATLLLHSFWNLLKVHPGFNPQNVLAINLWLPVPNDPKADRYPNPAQEAPFVRDVIRRVQTLPGIQEVALGRRDAIPLGHGQNDLNLLPVIFDGQETQINRAPLINASIVTPSYFHLMEIPLLQGRLFSDLDNSDAAAVAVVNGAFARSYSRNENPVGKRFKIRSASTPWVTIVGVVADARTESLDQASVPQIYLSLYQTRAKDLAIFVRGHLDLGAIPEELRQQVQSIDSTLPVFGAQTLEDALSASLAERRFSMDLLALFALSALFLAALGIYGVISYIVSERTHEIGVRIALGAQRSDIRQMVLRQGLYLALSGAGIGLAGALIVSRLMAGLLYGIAALDPLAFIGVTILLSAVALAACYVPARRATRVDPMVALRYE